MLVRTQIKRFLIVLIATLFCTHKALKTWLLVSSILPRPLKTYLLFSLMLGRTWSSILIQVIVSRLGGRNVKRRISASSCFQRGESIYLAPLNLSERYNICEFTGAELYVRFLGKKILRPNKICKPQKELS